MTSASLTDSVSVTGFSRLKEALNDGKTIHFTGERGVLNLQNSVNQGAGALYFNNDFTVKSTNSTDTWLGAGVSVADGKTVDWQVHNPENDRLSKIGQGTLLVNGTGVNQGDISVGDGTVILSQNADGQNQVKAFNQVGIVSGRGTVVLDDERQVEANNIYFGYRGGRLDTNGNNLTFNYIQNVDDGAQIVNHNRSQSANITITGKTYTDVTRTTSIVANGTSYYRSRGSRNMDYPVSGGANLDWVYLSSQARGMNPAFDEFNRQLREQSLLSFFNGVLGETDDQRHNGELNVVYQPTGAAKQNNAKLILTGGSNLTGNLTTVDGNLILSGRPTPRAINFANGTENTRDDDWLNRTFNATNIQTQGTSNLHIGRNVSAVNADIIVSNQSNATLGYINGITPVCVRSDYHGEGECSTPTYDNESILNNIPRTKINGNLTINDTAYVAIGKADVTAKTTASATSQMDISKDGHLILTHDSQVGHLNMTNGSQVTLNAAPNKETVEKYNKLTILGNLNGQGRFNYLTHLTQFKGDKVEVMGVAQGDYSLLVQHTGTQPTLSKEHLTLLNLTNNSQNLQNVNVSLANDNQAVDLGAYRYTLRNDGGHYYLYSAGLEKFLDEEEARRKAAEEEAKRQEEARRKAAEEEAKRQEEERRKATQAKVISRYTNTALSDLSSQMNSVVHLSNGLNRHLLGTKNSGMWINADRYSETSHRSDNYREYKKHETLTKIGADTQIDVQDGTLMLGAAWSYSQVDNTFDDAIKGDSDLNMASIYSKLTFNDDSFVTADVGYGSANNEINSAGEEVKFKRNVATAGVNIGKKFTTPIIDVQPSVGVRYHYLSDSEYTLNGAKIQIDDTNLVSYRAGVSLEKTIPLANGVMITPSISSHYVDANKDKATVIVNDIHQFQQEFGRYGQHEIGVSVSGAKWETAVTAIHSEGSEVNKQQSFGIKFRYQW